MNNYARSPGRRCALRWDDETSGRARSAVKPLAASAYWRMRSGVSAGPLRSAGRWPALLKLFNAFLVTKLRRHSMGELHTLPKTAAMRRHCATEGIVRAARVLKQTETRAHSETNWWKKRACVSELAKML